MIESVQLIDMHHVEIGIMATIKLPSSVVPRVGDLIRLESGVYKITGIVFSVNTEIQKAHLEDNVFECRLEKVP